MALTESGAVPERLIYAFASKVFCTTIPRPIGGKRAPGFLSFAGASAEELLIWIIEKAITSPTRRGRGKPLDPGDLLTMVVGFFNEVLTLHRSGSKDDLDNAVLRGMRRAGHLVNTGSRTILPPHLRGDADSSSFPQTPEQQHPNVSLGGSAVSGSRGTQEVFSSFVGMMDAPAERRQQHTNDVANASNHAIADRPPNSAYSDRECIAITRNSLWHNRQRRTPIGAIILRVPVLWVQAQSGSCLRGGHNNRSSAI
ncbi:hypothetical protein BC829DRAFT_129082 [Chytridium lagenaria]|nr:hypothetical protein BC829DRAFT_129082 [Chytridium lagenaria]